jgi:type IV secretion system protein VirB9
MKTAFSGTFVLVLLLGACRTTHFDMTDQAGPAEPEAGVESLGEEERADRAKMKAYAIEEELKEVDIEPTVIYIDRPVYSPDPKPGPEPAKGAQAVKDSDSAALQIPMRYVNGVMYYPYDDSFEYEIHTQPYRTTDVMLEPGEQVLEMPYLSEEKVWEVGAGVSRRNGQDVQHFFLKPAYKELATSMIIITDRRVYHLLLKSFPDRYMVMVQWEYPPGMAYHVKTDAMEARRINRALNAAAGVSPEFLSFDYKMTYSIFKKPLWLPQRVYDDGAKTYIQMDERMLHAVSPVLFNHRNERINYRVLKNLIVIDELIEKVTLRRGKQKVTITKKYYQPPKEVKEEPAEEEKGNREKTTEEE